MNAKDYPLSASVVRSLLDYDPLTGVFTWKSRPPEKGFHLALVGKEAGRISTTGYRTIFVRGFNWQAHRLAWLYMTGAMPLKNQDIDHRNLVRSDNRWDNLRIASAEQNAHNRRMTKRNTSGYKGVSFDSDRQLWAANIYSYGKTYFLGRFTSAKLAHDAYEAAANRLHGEFARAA